MKQHQPKIVAHAELLREIFLNDLQRNVKAYWEITDENGQVKKGECKSLVKNFAYIMQAMLSAANPTATRDISNTLRTLGISTKTSSTVGIVSAAGVLQSGTGSVAVSADDYAMGALYQTTGAVVLSTQTDTADQLQYTLQQSIVATSNTTLNEMGFVAKFYDSVNTSRDILIIRDLISGGFTTTNGVAYTMKVTLNWSVAANSYLTNFAMIWRGIMAGQNESLKNQGGSPFTCPILTKNSASTMGIVSAPATILFGVSTTAPTMDDFTFNRKLEESIACNTNNTVNDTAKLQWENYQAASFAASYQFLVGYDGEGNPIYENYTPPYTITEVGMVLKTFTETLVATPTLIVRCVLSPGVVVPSGSGLLGKFTHEIAV